LNSDRYKKYIGEKDEALKSLIKVYCLEVVRRGYFASITNIISNNDLDIMDINKSP
jgi:hypothetical protein